VPSSTSNSNPAGRAPSLSWGRVWIGALVVAVTATGLAESTWRAQGRLPSVVDDSKLWGYHRWLVNSDCRRIVALGASRIQLGLNTETICERFPSNPVSVLAIDGLPPIAALRDLAEDESFCGTILCGTDARGFSEHAWERQQEYVDNYYRIGPSQLTEAFLKSQLQSCFVFLNPNVSLLRLWQTWRLNNQLPSPAYIVTKTDRSRLGDFTKVKFNLYQYQQNRAQRLRSRATPLQFNRWIKDVREVGRWVKKIQSRGGKVVFLRMPTTGDRWRVYERIFPKNQFWDKLSNATGATTIHFIDVPSMTPFECPDGSHLDFRDTPAFTSVLLDELVQRGILSP
jgi:hypothetical protein